MFFGRKNKKKRISDLGSSGTSSAGSSSQSEIELACRDLMLASLESMRKEVISRPRSAEAAVCEFDIAAKVEADSRLESVSGQSVSDIQEVVCDPVSVEKTCLSEQKYSDNGGILRYDSQKQRIIDLIAAEDIMRAFVRPNSARCF